MHLQKLERANEELAQLVEESLSSAAERVAQDADPSWDDDNLKAMAAFDAIEEAERKRHNLRSMQAWLAVYVAKHKLYLAYPPTQKHPDGFGNLKEFLGAAGVGGSTLYELDGLATEIAPYLEKEGLEVDHLLNKNRYPKLAEAISTLRQLARGEESEYTAEEIIKDVERAQSRDEVRRKYRQVRYIGEGAVNRSGTKAIVTIVVPEENTGTVVNALQRKIKWELSATVSENGHGGYRIEVL